VSGGRKPDVVREKAIAALIETGSVDEAARRCKVSRRCLSSWINDYGEFKCRYNQARRQLLDEALLALQRCSRGAVAALAKAASQGDVRAASLLLEHALRVDAYLTLESRVRALEERKVKPP
jgi:hypothetical protein